MLFRRKRPVSPLITLESVGFHNYFLYDDRLYVSMGCSVDGDEYPIMRMDSFQMSKMPRSTLVLRVSVDIDYRKFQPTYRYY